MISRICLLFMVLTIAIGSVRGQLALPPSISPMLTPNDPCTDITNITESTISLPKHKYMVVEHCLYYSLQKEIDKNAKQPNAIALTPPHVEDGTKEDEGNVSINIYGVTIQSIWLNDMLKDSRVRGFLPVSWKDPRLTWKTETWKLDSMTIRTAAHIWVPKLSTEKHDSSMALGDVFEFKKISVSNAGNVSALIVFNLETFCDVDLHEFPSDVHTCCGQMEPTFYENMIDFKIIDSTYNVDTRYVKNTGYLINDVTLKTLSTHGTPALQFCISTIRSNSATRIELAVPMAICAILILFAPLFGSFKNQLQVKLFAMLLQYLCLQFLSNKLPYLGNGATPRIFRFYEFTIVMNMVSLLLTLFVAAASRMERNLPPAQSLLTLSTVINKFCFCLSVVDENESSNAASSGTGEEKKYTRDWRQVFSAVHGLLMTCVVIIYLVGVSIIYM